MEDVFCYISYSLGKVKLMLKSFHRLLLQISDSYVMIMPMDHSRRIYKMYDLVENWLL